MAKTMTKTNANPSKQKGSYQPEMKMVPVDQLVFYDTFNLEKSDNMFTVWTFAGYAKHLVGCSTSVHIESMSVYARATFDLKQMPIDSAIEEIRDFILFFEGPISVTMGTKSEISNMLET